MNNEEKEILLKLGLTNRETEVYLALLKEGQITAAEISKETKESRTNVYSTIDILIQKGFVNFVIKNGRKYFNAVTPKILLDIVKEQEQQVLDILPRLLSYEKPKKEPIKVEVYEGIEGIKTIWNEVLRIGKETLVIGTTGKSKEVLHEYNFIQFHKKRVKEKIPIKVLVNNTKEAIGHAKEMKKIGLSEYKILQQLSPTTIYVYENTTVIFMWTKEKPLIAIHINNKEIADSFKNYFKILWDGSI